MNVIYHYTKSFRCAFGGDKLAKLSTARWVVAVTFNCPVQFSFANSKHCIEKNHSANKLKRTYMRNNSKLLLQLITLFIAVRDVFLVAIRVFFTCV